MLLNNSSKIPDATRSYLSQNNHSKPNIQYLCELLQSQKQRKTLIDQIEYKPNKSKSMSKNKSDKDNKVKTKSNSYSWTKLKKERLNSEMKQSQISKSSNIWHISKIENSEYFGKVNNRALISASQDNKRYSNMSLINESYYKRWLNTKTPVLIETINDKHHDTITVSRINNNNQNQLQNQTIKVVSNSGKDYIAEYSTNTKSNNHKNRQERDCNSKGKENQISKAQYIVNKSTHMSPPSLPTNLTTQKTNNLIRKLTIKNINEKEKRYKYYISPSNNGKLIEKCLLTRPKWEAVDPSYAVIANLFWVPLSGEVNFQKSDEWGQFVNHFEYHSELSNKMKLFINLLSYCEHTKIDLFSFFPLTAIFQLSNHCSYIEQLYGMERCYNDFPKIMENNLNPLATYFKYFNVNFSKKAGTVQKLSIPSTHYLGKNLWLIKPVNLNRGRCIKLYDSFDDIKREMNTLKESKQLPTDKNNIPKQSNNTVASGLWNKQPHKWEYIIIQKYIEHPLLYMNRKFDIRIWVWFTDKNDVYVFKEGHLKVACDSYNINSNDLYVHLTNYSVQKHNSNFSKISIGNEITFDDFQKEWDRISFGKINFRKDIYTKICHIIKITALAVKGKLNLQFRRNCFELFGYDFLIDSRFNPFWLEVNTNPGLEESSPLIKMLLPRMIDDAMRLTIDTFFMRNGFATWKNSVNDKYEKISPFEVEGYRNDENMWEKIKT